MGGGALCLQAIETLARSIVHEATKQSSIPVELANIQLGMELSFCKEQQKVATGHDDRMARIAAKVQHILQQRKANPTVQEMNRLYDQVLAPAFAACVAIIPQATFQCREI
jgi:hypothetical protein